MTAENKILKTLLEIKKDNAQIKTAISLLASGKSVQRKKLTKDEKIDKCAEQLKMNHRGNK